MGIQFNKTINTELNDQVGHYNITTFKGRRYSSAKALIPSSFFDFKDLSEIFWNKLFLRPILPESLLIFLDIEVL